MSAATGLRVITTRPAQGVIIRGEAVAQHDVRPYLDTQEPSNTEAAELVQALMGAGTVARLDLIHDALRAAYRRGRAAEHVAVARLADEHAAMFTAAAQQQAAAVDQLAQLHAGLFTDAVAQRGQEQDARDALPWHQRRHQ